MNFKPTVLFASMVAAGAIATSPAMAAYGPVGKLGGCVRNPHLEYMQSIVDRNASGLKNVDPCFAKSWYDRIRISGMINVDNAWSSKSNFAASTATNVGRYSTTYASDITLNNASIFVDAMIASWVNAHVALDYHNAENAIPTPSTNNAMFGFDPANTLNVEEAHVTLGDLSRWPVYARVGKQYLNYGHYTLHPLTQTFTQLMTQTNKVAATLGFVIPMGFYGSIYAFRGADRFTGVGTGVLSRRRIDNYGAQLGYGMQNQVWGFNVQGGYLRNISDTQYIQYNVLAIADIVNFAVAGAQGAYVRKVGGFAVSGTGNYGPFDGTVNYTVATQRFPMALVAFGASGAKPYAMDFDLGYSFKLMGYDSRLGVSYQFTKKASGLVLPRDRYLADYRVNVAKFTDLEFQLYHDRDYSRRRGGSSGNATVGKIRVAVAFA